MRRLSSYDTVKEEQTSENQFRYIYISIYVWIYRFLIMKQIADDDDECWSYRHRIQRFLMDITHAVNIFLVEPY